MHTSPDPETTWTVKRLMTEVVGSGHKSAEDMSYTQARTAMEQILQGTPDDITLGAFWLANRWKRNTPEELAAYVDVMGESITTTSPDCDPVDCGANYDGKGESAILGVAAGLVSATAETPVVVHSADRIPTQEQDVYKHVLDKLGVQTDISPSQSATMCDEIGFGFYYRPNFAPEIEQLTPQRSSMGVRTFLNTIETLANPANTQYHLGSFYHLPFAKRVIETLARAESSSFDRIVMIQGSEGYDDIRPDLTKVGVGDDTKLRTDFEIRPADIGAEINPTSLAVQNVASESASITESALRGNASESILNAVAINAAVRMFTRDDVTSIESGYSKARAILENGTAYDTLESLRSF